MTQDEKTFEHNPAPGVALNGHSDEARLYLEEQTRLTRLQIEQLRQEDRLRLRMLRFEHWSGVLKFALELAVGVVALAIIVALSAWVWSAAHDKGLVVESFSVPPDLVSRGLTGDVVATKLLDKLSAMQAQTVSNRAPSSYANNWGSDIKVQIPDTGVSIGEFNRYLRNWLGHPTRISGEIYRTDKGLSVTARAGSATSPTFSGSEAELDALMLRAAEQVYRATQPYRYAVYLANVGRTTEADAAYRALIATGSMQDRAWGYIGLESLLIGKGDTAGSLKALNQALAIRPDFFMAYTNMAGTYGQLQQDEPALAAQRKAVELLRAHHDRDLSDTAVTIGIPTSEAALAADIGDYTAQLSFNRIVEAMPDFGGQGENARDNDIIGYGFLHDGRAARAAYAALPPNNAPFVALGRDANMDLAELLTGNPFPLLKDRARFDAVLSKNGAFGIVAQHRLFWPTIAVALATVGDFKGAHALVDRTPADCIICLRMRGRIDQLERNYAGATYWFARAVHDAPSVPFARVDWGQMQIERGDAAGAMALFSAAHDVSPHLADTFEGWGEALILENRGGEAPAKFAEAANYAPNWGRLHLKWGEALQKAGDNPGAQKQFALASRLELTRDERAELMRDRHG